MPRDPLPDLAARLVVSWLNARHGRAFGEASRTGEDGPFLAAEGPMRLAVQVAALWEGDPAWDERRLDAAERIRAGLRGPFLLWAPPGADLPQEEPAASEFVRRIAVRGAPMAPATRVEVEFPVRVRLAKTRDEGGYASVVGGLGRYWTAITERVSGTFVLDSTAIRRAPLDERMRDSMFDRVAQVATQVETGQAVEFELWDSWTLQRLDAGDGFALVGAPPSSDPTDGATLRRVIRRRLEEAAVALDGVEADVRCVALVAIVEFAEHEGVSSALRSVAPALYAPFDLLAVLADGEVKPALRPRPLPWQ